MRILLLLLFLVLTKFLSAQEFLELDLQHHCHFGGGEQDEELYVFTSGSKVMENLVTRILQLGGELERNFTLIQTNVESVSALESGGKRYLLWSQDFLERATELQAYASVAHAIGHHINQHTFEADLQVVEEEEANIFMGYVLMRQGYVNPAALRDIFKKEKGHEFTHNWNGAWLEAAQKGHQKALIGLKIGSRGWDTDPSLQRFLNAEFPFPPPPCYQQVEIAPKNFKSSASLGQVAQTIAQALKSKKYPHRYLSVPDGFAIVTQIEQYQSDGAALSGSNRWKELPVQEDFALTLSYLKQLVFPRKAHLRVFVFVVTNQNFNATGKQIEEKAVRDWFNQAVNRLPKTVAAAPYTTDHTVEMLVYEFEVPEANQRPTQHCPCHLQAGDHLKKSGLEAWLKP